MRIAWRLSGVAGGPVVAVLGGISAHRQVDTSADGEEGWWSAVVAPGGWLDTRSYRILSMDYLAGIGASSGPDDHCRDFPLVDTRDQAEALLRVMAHLDMDRLHALIGLSYGGQVALQFAAAHAEKLRHLIVYGAAARADAAARAQRSIQRWIVQAGLDTGRGEAGVVLARELAILGYCGEAELQRWFGTAPEVHGHALRDPCNADLRAQGRAFAARCNAMRYLRLCQSCDLHAVDAVSLSVPASVIACRQDRLASVDSLRALAADSKAELHEFDSAFGHDAFLREPERIGTLMRSALSGVDP